MTEWRRVPVYTRCGLCGELIPTESPALFIKLESVKRERIRCASCVGEAPPDLPPRERPAPTTKKFKPITMAIPKHVRDFVERPRYGEDR